MDLKSVIQPWHLLSVCVCVNDAAPLSCRSRDFSFMLVLNIRGNGLCYLPFSVLTQWLTSSARSKETINPKAHWFFSSHCCFPSPDRAKLCQHSVCGPGALFHSQEKRSECNASLLCLIFFKKKNTFSHCMAQWGLPGSARLLMSSDLTVWLSTGTIDLFTVFQYQMVKICWQFKTQSWNYSQADSHVLVLHFWCLPCSS